MKTNFLWIEKLLKISTPELAPFDDNEVDTLLTSGGVRGREVLEMLRTKNGFYTFEGALHVFPINPALFHSQNLLEWNRQDRWRNCYGESAHGLLFFAEDIFGVQFAVREGQIVSFDPETAKCVFLADTLDEWAREILSRYADLTGHPVARAWQQLNGPLPIGKRLVPKIPFILGGKFDVSNLSAIDATQAMRYRGDLWQQIRDLPDGVQVRLLPLPDLQ